MDNSDRSVRLGSCHGDGMPSGVDSKPDSANMFAVLPFGHASFVSNPTAEPPGADPVNPWVWTALAAQIPMTEHTLDARADIAAVAEAERGRIRLQDRLNAARGREIILGLAAHGVEPVPRVIGRVLSTNSVGALLERDGHEYELCMVLWSAVAWIRDLPWALRDERGGTNPASPRITSQWTQLLRAVQHLSVRVRISDGQVMRGRAQLGEDFISVVDEHGLEWTVPLGTALLIEFQRLTD